MRLWVAIWYDREAAFIVSENDRVYAEPLAKQLDPNAYKLLMDDNVKISIIPNRVRMAVEAYRDFHIDTTILECGTRTTEAYTESKREPE